MWQPDEDDPFFPPAPKKRIKGTGTYPPDIARIRRKYGLPVTREEFVAYEAKRAWHPK